MKNVISLIERHCARLSIRKPFIQLAADITSFVQFIQEISSVGRILRGVQKAKIVEHRPLQISLRRLQLEVDDVKRRLDVILDSHPSIKNQIDPFLFRPFSQPVFGVSEIKNPFFQADDTIRKIYENIRALLERLLLLGQKEIVGGFARIIEFSDGYGFEATFPSTDETNQLFGILKGKRQSELWGCWDTILRFYEQIKHGVSPINTALITNLANLANHEKLYDHIDRFCLYLLQNLYRIQDESCVTESAIQSNKQFCNETNPCNQNVSHSAVSLNVVNTSIVLHAESGKQFNEDMIDNQLPKQKCEDVIQSPVSKANTWAATGDLSKQNNNNEIRLNDNFAKNLETIRDFYFNSIEFFYDSINGNLWIILHTPKDLEKYFMGHFKNGRADDLAQKLMQAEPTTIIRGRRLSHTCGELKLTKDLKRVFFSSASNGKILNIWSGAVVHASSIQTGGKPFSPQKIIQQLHQIHSAHGVAVPEFPIHTYSNESRAYQS